MEDNMSKKFYWLKLKDDFFNQKEIKKLRRIAGGDTYTIIYLKLQLLSLKKEAIITFDGTERNLAEQLSYEIDENVDNIEVTLSFLRANNLIEQVSENDFLLPKTSECIGKEGSSAERVRRHRERKALDEQKGQIPLLEEPKTEPFSNAKRQKMFRAKKNCEGKQHIPFIEDYINRQRYNGNYYIVLQRDRCKCVLCNEIENLCVHHIDGYNESVTQNSNENKLITLCRKCHSNIHAGKQIDEDVLFSIGYYDLEEEKNDNVTLLGNVTVTKCNTEKEKEKEKDILKKENNKNKSSLNLIIEEYTDKIELIDMLKDFLKMRKSIKKPMTDRALKILLTKLDKLAGNDINKKLYILEESIVNSWQSIFEPKNYIPTKEVKNIKKNSNFDY